MLPAPLRKSIEKVPSTVVNHIVEPSPSYFDPFMHTHSDLDLDVGLENIYKLESLGINEDSDVGSIDTLFIQKFHEGIIFKEGKYHVELPWYDDVLEAVPSNHKVALAALYRVKKRLEEQGLVSAYGDIFKQYLKEGIIEPIQVSPKDFHKFIWIPHRPVLKTAEQVTTKIRPVFNCSLRIGNSPSLNQAAFQGVDLLASLFKLLLNFRTNRYVVLADISKAFLQIRLKLEKDRNRFCFFWEEEGSLRTFRYTTIIFGLAVSPYILGAVIRHHARQYPPDIYSSLLQNNLYMDNLIYTNTSVDVLKDVFKTTCDRMREGGFDLGSWNSNCPELRELFEQNNKNSSHKSSDERVLGYLFDTSSDTLKLSDFVLGSVTSKRQLLSEIAKVFDPLSLFLPVTIRGRLLMRRTWEQEIGWDDEIDIDLKTSWEKLRLDLNSLKEVTFPRSCFETAENDLSLKIFCDASSVCYGFVVYVTSSSKGPNILWAKGKVAPMKSKTLPCLELLSIFLALKCLPQVLSGFPDSHFRSLYIFSDSQISLQWVLHGGKKNKSIFVKNRIQDIRRMISSLKEEHLLQPEFHFVRSEENPADLLTRGLSLKEFRKKFSLWLSGPEWLASAPIYWPEIDWSNTEIRTVTSVLSTFQATQDPPAIDFSKFSNVGTLLRVCALLYKFSALTRGLNVDSDAQARLYCLKIMQRESFTKELKFLERVREDSSSSEPPPDLVNNLNLFLDDNGLIRSKGRLARSNYYSFDIINPVVLGKNHHLTYLFIRKAHFDCKHLGIQATLTNIRLKGFWITAARSTIKKVLAECITCRKFNNFAYKYPRFTNFTKAQVDLFRPFQHVGVDFTKHWWIKVKGSTQAQKMFILIYTCLNIRAIYLDLIPDMSSATFVQSFQRFVNRFGVPDVVYSDNARSFAQGTDAIELFVVSENGKEFLRKNQIIHRRIPLYSPWVGSQWERMLRVVKSCLMKTIGRSSIEYFNFVTTLSDIEDAINSRPLTYASSENDIIPLTPNCFLKQHAKTSLVLPGKSKNDRFWSSPSTARNALLQSLEKTSKIFEEFRTRWYEEYLLSLRETSRDLYQTNWNNLVKVDDVVLIRSSAKERPFWQMGVVTQLIYGDDNRIRSVFVRTPGGQINTYPIKHLYPLELSLTHSGNRPSSETSSISTSQALPDPSANTSVRKSVVKRPTRRAAVVANLKFVEQTSSDESE